MQRDPKRTKRFNKHVMNTTITLDVTVLVAVPLQHDAPVRQQVYTVPLGATRAEGRTKNAAEIVT
jgi:hypothetical protein